MHRVRQGSLPQPDAKGVSSSKHIDRREAWLLCDAIPKVNCQADIAGPEGVPPTADGDLSAPILDDGGHGEFASTVEPNGVLRAAVELQECVAISACAVAKVRAFGQWSGGPGEATLSSRQGV